ncbi:hypothetical protein C3432_12080 [Citrobacter amalonaticus]|uniref:YdgH/BhsA/McbA-like domain-containing protein n=1 Tax=Citrobacter amalonaticus TaxID=35703 RepID=A0A2S4RRK9_CITAM|nr:DUF1471 domain-containing protein [Citrobacter amalonaticus]POT58614.1 hypothetical protein C3432_12080 [Citrobacter amalonaticus]POT70352.1 hypothetical protein C3436_24780 [Citrobacter amalonaticus]POU61336.1 hypothetical protein C3430_23690 [Citrobacter amalonaticus]POV05095.1 hypothetical protein C3424_07040 [Citrobacter amalonaticus]
MKKIAIAVLLGSVFGFSAYASEQITPEQASKYSKIGEISVTEDGFTMTDDGLSKKVDEKGGKYYVITSVEGHSEHKTINADIYN